MGIGHHYLLDENHQPYPVTGREWARGWPSCQRVALTEIGGIVVSTVFLGLDHQYGDGPPILFETMVFGEVVGAEPLSGGMTVPLHAPTPIGDGVQLRYSTWAEAMMGHRKTVERLASALARVNKLMTVEEGEGR